jgi:hypothetical protein
MMRESEKALGVEGLVSGNQNQRWEELDRGFGGSPHFGSLERAFVPAAATKTGLKSSPGSAAWEDQPADWIIPCRGSLFSASDI